MWNEIKNKLLLFKKICILDWKPIFRRSSGISIPKDWRDQAEGNWGDWSQENLLGQDQKDGGGKIVSFFWEKSIDIENNGGK